MIDEKGYRANVGIILTNGQGRLFWARRVGQDSWQFPQGGLNDEESPEQAMYRELREEVGLEPRHVKLIGSTKSWLHYDLPARFIRRNSFPRVIGQKQIWYLLVLSREGEEHVRFDTTDKPEFDDWKWVEPWEPLKRVVFFKRDVYFKALQELAPVLFPDGVIPYYLKRKDKKSSNRHPARRRTGSRGEKSSRRDG